MEPKLNVVRPASIVNQSLLCAAVVNTKPTTAHRFLVRSIWHDVCWHKNGSASCNQTSSECEFIMFADHVTNIGQGRQTGPLTPGQLQTTWVIHILLQPRFNPVGWITLCNVRLRWQIDTINVNGFGHGNFLSLRVCARYCEGALQ